MSQKTLDMIFVETALAYELGGDWKGVLKHYHHCCTGLAKRFCENGIKRTDADLEAGIKIFLMEDSDE